jgi:hypothetical protein
MSIAQERILGLKSSQKGSINICPNANRYKDLGILRIKLTDGTQGIHTSGHSTILTHSRKHFQSLF